MMFHARNSFEDLLRKKMAYQPVSQLGVWLSEPVSPLKFSPLQFELVSECIHELVVADLTIPVQVNCCNHCWRKRGVFREGGGI